MQQPKDEVLDLREKLARIDAVLAQHDREGWHEGRYTPIVAMISGMTAGAALVAAGFALAKLVP